MIFNFELSFIPHIKNITKIGFYDLKNIVRVRPFLSQASTDVLMHAFISCHLDYYKALLSGLPKKSISDSTITTKLSRTSADKDQHSAGAHYTSFDIVALAYV